jgi:hypothetical protein
MAEKLKDPDPLGRGLFVEVIAELEWQAATMELMGVKKGGERQDAYLRQSRRLRRLAAEVRGWLQQVRSGLVEGVPAKGGPVQVETPPAPTPPAPQAKVSWMTCPACAGKGRSMFSPMDCAACAGTGQVAAERFMRFEGPRR